MTITVRHRVPRDDLAFGLVRVEGIETGQAPEALAAELGTWIARRRDEPLDDAAEARRKAGRDVLRNGKYKPTGRGKPAAEYLVRAAGEGKLGSINLAVDLCNVVSLHSGLPISVVDLDRAVCRSGSGSRNRARVTSSTLRTRRSTSAASCACSTRRGRARTR